MKALFVCEGLNTVSARAQPWRHVIEISKRIQGLGNTVQIISDSRERSKIDDDIQGVPIKRIKKKGLLFDINELVETISEEDVDIINWNASDTWSSYYFWRIEKSAPIVWTLHSGPLSINDLNNLRFRDVVQLYRYWNNFLNAIFPSFVIRKWIGNSKIKQIVTLSKRLLRHLCDRAIGIDINKISVIPSGVDTSQFRPSNQEDARKNLGLWSGDPTLIYYGPMSSFRGIDTLLAAIPFIKGEIPSVKLLLLGRGSEVNIEWSRYFDNTSVKFVSGILTEDTIIQYLAAADVVILPFKFWPQVECPLTILESMALEKAVVSTSTGAIPEIISSGENGVLVPPRNPLVLAKNVTELLQTPELRRRIGANARKHVEKNYDWKKIVMQTLDIFKDAA